MRGVALGLALAAAACFTPKLDPCALQCAAGNDCPRGTTCLADGFCHDSAEETLCSGVDIDASVGIDADTTPDANLPDAMVCLTACGNGAIEAGEGEECDDGNCDPGDGCSATCQEEQFFVCINDPEPSVCRAEPMNAGDLLITEIFANPNGVGEADGEWFEVFNPTTTEFDLLGIRVSDNNTDNFEVDVSLPLPAGATVVLGANGDTAENGGVTLDFVYDRAGAPFILSNDNDEIRIQARQSATILDGVDYNTAAGFIEPADIGDQSLSLDPDLYDPTLNNDGANWCAGQMLFGTDNGRGTPGIVNEDCPP